MVTCGSQTLSLPKTKTRTGCCWSILIGEGKWGKHSSLAVNSLRNCRCGMINDRLDRPITKKHGDWVLSETFTRLGKLAAGVLRLELEGSRWT